MDYVHIFDISASGMDFQRLRLEAIATNIANAQTTSPHLASLYRPLQAVSSTQLDFSESLGSASGRDLIGVQEMRLEPQNVDPRRVYDPEHPHADGDGFVFYPHVDMVDAMTSLMMTSRAYEANVAALNAAKAMALKALEIGK